MAPGCVPMSHCTLLHTSRTPMESRGRQHSIRLRGCYATRKLVADQPFLRSAGGLRPVENSNERLEANLR